MFTVSRNTLPPSKTIALLLTIGFLTGTRAYGPVTLEATPDLYQAKKSTSVSDWDFVVLDLDVPHYFPKATRSGNKTPEENDYTLWEMIDEEGNKINIINCPDLSSWWGWFVTTVVMQHSYSFENKILRCNRARWLRLRAPKFTSVWEVDSYIKDNSLPEIGGVGWCNLSEVSLRILRDPRNRLKWQEVIDSVSYRGLDIQVVNLK